jgi:hypothetical protein
VHSVRFLRSLRQLFVPYDVQARLHRLTETVRSAEEFHHATAISKECPPSTVLISDTKEETPFCWCKHYVLRFHCQICWADLHGVYGISIDVITFRSSSSS